ncbi:MAG TPA: NAD-dependent epimerase/dehydratase family protein [Bacteriovoracaceae bacterium]|nr:NAD-dependent epimerase/dehydratase family protein [Bacteriovoracaceae bacterium]
MKKILIAGASGFIGRALIDRLLKDPTVQIVGLSRGLRESHHERLTWKKCDLFSLKDISLAIDGCQEAYYLVHSMLPSASLSQGTFYDFDLIMADNFVRAAKKFKLQHLLYLGGMIPLGEELSWHLKSRLEVEETIRASGIKTTVLRAGLIVGAQGSSFTILQRLIEKLPVMICPAWTNSRSQPVALGDVINVLERCSNDGSVQGRIYDVGGPEIITYQGLIVKAAAKIRKNTKIFTLNIIPIWLSRYWVSLITGVPKDLVYPLVLSLKYEMLAQKEYAWPHPEDVKTSLDETLTDALITAPKKAFKGHVPVQKDVRSIQRLVLPPGRDAAWVAEEYFQWLPRFFSTLVKVTLEGDTCTFYLVRPNIRILILKKSPERSTPDRQLMYVVGGILSAEQDRGRLEFREVLDKRYVMSALHEFRPALPWYVYRYSQALVHLIVMKAFGEYLKWHVISGKK